MVGLLTLVLLAACGGDGGSPSPTEPSEAGRGLAQRKGCVACHSASGQAGVGPTWRGLAGSVVELSDGSRVVADAVYLRSSIRQPSAQRVAGFTATMPQVMLSDADVDALVAYIESLGD